MKKYFKEVVLDFSGGASSQRIVAKQGDKKSRIIKINPILNGQQLIIDEGCTIDFRCIKPDKKIVIAEATKESDGKITVEVLYILNCFLSLIIVLILYFALIFVN